MLKLGGVAFTQGRSIFLDHQQRWPETTAKIYVRLLVGYLDLVVNAQLDTGAAWSVLDPLLARPLGLLDRDTDEHLTIIDTRFGRMKGHLARIPIRFLAEEGESYDTTGTFFISPDWPPGRTFLGYSGLLDSIRFALDPQENHFYFGPGV